MGRVSVVVVVAMLLGACSSPAATPAGTPHVTSRPAGPTPSATSAAIVERTPRLTLTVDARPILPGRCARASVSTETGRPRVSLEWRWGERGWAPWPAGPGGRIRRRVTVLPLCPGWSAEPLEVRAVAEDVQPSPPAQVHVRAEPWMPELDRLIGDRPLSASVMVDGSFVFGHLAGVRRAPASNEKLLLSMAMLDRYGPGARIPTEAAATHRLLDGTVNGDLYLVGAGDPEVGLDDIRRLAQRLHDAGLERVQDSVVADTSTFVRDRRARGWHPIALRYIGLPTALSFEANADANGFVFDPERRAAAALAGELRALGVSIGGPPGASDAVPGGLRTIERVRSAPMAEILRRQNVSSINLDAETLSKLLATDRLDRPASIADGARVIERWANGLAANVSLHDASGLSYRNRVSTASMAALLDDTLLRSWGAALRDSLPAPGEGTLGGRLAGLTVRAKTGTLIRNVSALAGYVLLRDGRWASFSIMSRLPKHEAIALEDAIVRTIAQNV